MLGPPVAPTPGRTPMSESVYDAHMKLYDATQRHALESARDEPAYDEEELGLLTQRLAAQASGSEQTASML